MVRGVYNSAKLVSVNNNLRKSIRKHALESRLLGAIGQAERENEIQKIVTKITRDKKNLMTQTKQPMELDEKELKKYVSWIVREAERKGNINDREGNKLLHYALAWWDGCEFHTSSLS
jgi:uncharacterized membrane protein